MRQNNMRPKKWQQRVGLVIVPLTIGLLGGLLTPLPSDALQPTLTVKVDNGTPVNILITASSTCTPTEVQQGFTHCYAINTSATVTGTNAAGVTRSYFVRNAPNQVARLRAADVAGFDFLSLAGVHFIPTQANWGTAEANANEQHTVTLTMKGIYDSSTNVGNGGTFAWGVRAGLEFRSGPDPRIPTNATACAGKTPTGKCDSVGNSVSFPGKGTFSPTLVSVPILNPAGSTTNTRALALTVEGPRDPIVSIDGLTEKTLGQVSPSYPKFVCDTDGATGGQNVCKETVEQTMTVTLKGPDSFVVVKGGEVAGALCTIGISAQQERQLDLLAKVVRFLQWLEKQRPNNHRLSAFIDKLEAFLATATRTNDPECPGASVVDLFMATQAAQDQIVFFTDGAVPVEPAPTTSTITIKKFTDFETHDTFTFHISGPSPSVPTIPMGGANSGSIVVTVTPGTYGIDEESLYGWSLQSEECTGEVSPSSFDVPPGENVTCTFSNVRVPVIP